MIKQSILDRIKQALEIVSYNDSIKAYVISAKYWENLEPDTFNLYSNYIDLKHELINEIVRRFN